MEEILKKANELGHLLRKNEIVRRFMDLSTRLEGDEEAKKILEEFLQATEAFQRKEEEGKPIEVEEKKRLSELQEKAKNNTLLSEFLATQAYYINLLAQVNEAIANPKGEPPRKSSIIMPGEDPGIIIN